MVAEDMNSPLPTFRFGYCPHAGPFARSARGKNVQMKSFNDSIIGSQTAGARPALWLALITCFVLLGSLPGKVEGQVFCDPINPTYGTCILQSGTFPGDLPFATTVNVSTRDLFIADYLSGVFYRFSEDLGALPVAQAAPKGPATYLGLSWSGIDNNLYWIINDQGNDLLVVSSLGGSLISETPLNLPAGVTSLTGLAWFPSSNSFWTNDFENDTYHELLPDGTFTGQTFGNPEQDGSAAGAFGLGITVVQDLNTLEFFFDLPVGSPAANRTNKVERVSVTGEVQGLSFPLASLNNMSGWVTGIAWTPFGSYGGPSNYLLDLTNGTVVEVAVPTPLAPSITDIACSADNNNDVNLNWTNPITYDTISVLRDGAEIAVLGAGVDSYVDVDVDPGTFSYEVIPTPAGSADGLPAATCEVVVGFGRFLGAVAHSGALPGGVAVVESTDQLLVADSSGLSAWSYQKDLTPTGVAIPGPFSSSQTLSGIAWNSDTDQLAWLTENADFRITDLAGTEVSASLLNVSSGQVLSGLTYSPTLGKYLTVNLSTQQILTISTDGIVEVHPAEIPTRTSPTVFFGGIAIRGGSTLVFDLAYGSLASGGVTRLERLVGGAPVGLGFDLTPSVNSGDIHGLDGTESGPFGFPVSYVIGRDSGVITMLSSDLSGTGSDFIRGDVVPDGDINIVDVSQHLILQFAPGQDPSLCLDALDANDDGSVDISDAIYMLSFLFEGGPQMPAPTGTCGTDDTVDNLICQEFEGC